MGGFIHLVRGLTAGGLDTQVRGVPRFLARPVARRVLRILKSTFPRRASPAQVRPARLRRSPPLRPGSLHPDQPDTRQQFPRGQVAAQNYHASLPARMLLRKGLQLRFHGLPNDWLRPVAHNLAEFAPKTGF